MIVAIRGGRKGLLGDQGLSDSLAMQGVPSRFIVLLSPCRCYSVLVQISSSISGQGRYEFELFNTESI